VKIQINWCFDFRMTYIWSIKKTHSNNINNDKREETTKRWECKKKGTTQWQQTIPRVLNKHIKTLGSTSKFVFKSNKSHQDMEG
jgi:hypothetical protein